MSIENLDIEKVSRQLWERAIFDALRKQEAVQLKEDVKTKHDRIRKFGLTIKTFRECIERGEPWPGIYEMPKRGVLLLYMKSKKTQKPKRQGPLRIPLPFEQAVAGLLQVKPEPKKRATRKTGKK